MKYAYSTVEKVNQELADYDKQIEVLQQLSFERKDLKTLKGQGTRSASS